MMRTKRGVRVMLALGCAGMLALAAVAGGTAWAAGKAKSAKAIKTGELTLVGEVVSMECYLGSPEFGKGPDHAECAKSCLSSGKTAGFLSTDGVLYLVMEGGDASLKDMLPPVAGYPARLTGTVVDQDGLHVIFAEKAELIGGKKS